MKMHISCNGFLFDISNPLYRKKDSSFIISVWLDGKWEPFCITDMMKDYSCLHDAVLLHSEQFPDCISYDEVLTIDTILNIKSMLYAIDAKSSRPIRAILAGTATDEDRSYLGLLEAQAQKLRSELQQLEK